MQYLMIRSIQIFFELLMFLMVVRMFVSFLPIDGRSPLIKLLYQLTDPVMEPARRLLDRLLDRFNIDTGMIDFSPTLAFFLLYIVEVLVIRLIMIFM